MNVKPTYAELEQEIAKLKETLHEQSRLENQCRKLVDSTSDSLYIVDGNGRYFFMNQIHAQRLNIPETGYTGLSYKDVHSPQQSEQFEARVKTVFETGIAIHDEYQHPEDGGYLLRTFSPVKDSTDPMKITAVSVVSRDITKIKKLEEALEKSEEKYRQLIEYSSEAIFIVTNGKISYANNSTQKMIGYPLEDLKLISFINLMISEDREMVFNRQKAILQGYESANHYTFRIETKEGSTIWVEADSVAIQWEGVTSTLNFMRDITKQKKTETRLLQAQKMESIGTLAGGIAHDFNNLLMGIQGHTSLSLLKLNKNDIHYEHLYEHIKTIETLVTSGANLTKQLLGFARGGKYEVKRADLNTLIEKTSKTIGRTKKEIRIHRNLEKDLWPTDVDQGQIEQVLLNLFVNAWQAMPNGGDLYIETKNIFLDEDRFKAYGKRKGRYVKISVTDTGIGMDEKTKERIFEPFFTTKEMGHGTGLGLASVYGIIKNHNGFINVYSEKGKGTTFNIYLPASTPDDQKDEDRELDVAGDILCTETVLLVDDETMVLNVASDMMRTMGYTVITASDGSTAVNLYRENHQRIDLVMLDMVMPDMSGSDVFDEIKKINPQAKVLLSSGYSLNGQASRIMERGCDGFIQKPFTLDEISTLLRQILGQSRKK